MTDNNILARVCINNAPKHSGKPQIKSKEQKSIKIILHCDIRKNIKEITKTGNIKANSKQYFLLLQLSMEKSMSAIKKLCF